MSLHSDTELYRAVIDFQKFVAGAVIHLRRDVKQMYGERLVDESLWMPVIVRHAFTEVTDMRTADTSGQLDLFGDRDASASRMNCFGCPTPRCRKSSGTRR